MAIHAALNRRKIPLRRRHHDELYADEINLSHINGSESKTCTSWGIRGAV